MRRGRILLPIHLPQGPCTPRGPLCKESAPRIGKNGQEKPNRPPPRQTQTDKRQRYCSERPKSSPYNILILKSAKPHFGARQLVGPAGGEAARNTWASPGAAADRARRRLPHPEWQSCWPAGGGVCFAPQSDEGSPLGGF